MTQFDFFFLTLILKVNLVLRLGFESMSYPRP